MTFEEGFKSVIKYQYERKVDLNEKITNEIITKFREYLICEEKSDNTIEKYMREKCLEILG